MICFKGIFRKIIPLGTVSRDCLKFCKNSTWTPFEQSTAILRQFYSSSYPSVPFLSPACAAITLILLPQPKSKNKYIDVHCIIIKCGSDYINRLESCHDFLHISVQSWVLNDELCHKQLYKFL